MGNVAALLLAAVVAISLLMPAAFAGLAQTVLRQTLDTFGWFYLLVVSGALLLLVYLAFSRHASVCIGGPDTEPDFSTVSWFSMLFAAGMGIGLVFFGAAEPVSHLFAPPEGLDPQTPLAARAAMRYAFFHWGLHPWAVYGLVGLAIAYFRFNHGANGQFSGLLDPLLGKWSGARAAKVVDLLAILATVGGVATSLGFGAAQISGGIAHLTGLPAGRGTQLIVIAIATVLFLTSAATGVQRGIKILSNTNLVMAVALLLAVLLLGPTRFVLETFTTSLGSYVNQLAGMSLRLTPFTQRTWVAEWTAFYWAWWISWAPFVGSFIAQISRGRTIRQFVVGVLLVPTLFCFFWFSTFGGVAIHQQLFGGVDLAPAMERGSEFVLFAVLEHLPLPAVTSVIALVLLIIFFVTSADSATLVLASMASGGALALSLRSKLTWGLLISGIAAALLVAGGLDGLQAGAVVSALPFAVVLCLVAASLLRRLDQDHRARHEQEMARRRLVDELVAKSRAEGGKP